MTWRIAICPDKKLGQLFIRLRKLEPTSLPIRISAEGKRKGAKAGVFNNDL